MWTQQERHALDDLTRELHARGWASHVTVENLVDQIYREATDEDGGVAISRYFHLDGKSGWWWQRRPTLGALAEYLNATFD